MPSLKEICGHFLVEVSSECLPFSLKSEVGVDGIQCAHQGRDIRAFI